jgi:hypothetical protein
MDENEPNIPEAELEAASETANAQRAPRPFSVTLLALGVIIISALNLARFMLALRYWDYLDRLTTVSPWYLALSGLVWGLAGLPLAWGLLWRKAWSPGLMRAMALTYATYYWLDQVFLQDHPLNNAQGGARLLLLPGNWPFEAGLTVLLLAFTAWSLKRKSAQVYFGEVNEHRPENETLT